MSERPRKEIESAVITIHNPHMSFLEARYGPKSYLPTADIDYLRGKPKWTFPFFEHTPSEIELPFRGYRTTEYALNEIDGITQNVLEKEPFHEFYRHIYMLQHFGSAQRVAEFVPLVMERTHKDTRGFLKETYPYNIPAQKRIKDIISLTALACVETCEEDPSVRFSKPVVAQLYDDALDSQPISLRYALVFDNRNKMYGESIAVAERVKEKLAVPLLNPERKYTVQEKELVSSIYVDAALESSLLISAVLHASSNKQMFGVIRRLAPIMGIEGIRKSLREYMESADSFRQTFETIFDYLGLDPGVAQVNLEKDVYEKIEFSAYKPNEELQKFDVDLLKRECTGKDRILDIACGTGRHLESIDGHNGLRVTGVDLVKKHIDQIKTRNPQRDVHVGSWFDLPFPDEGFDAAYCLGRSFMHNTTIPDTVSSLQEMRRVISDDGFLLVDLPDPTVGEYKEQIERTKKIVAKNGIKDILPGLITDSPDLEHYFDRYAPDPIAFKAIAELAGFKAEQLATISYQGIQGEENNNIYWKLTKKDFPRASLHPWGGRISKRPRLSDLIRNSDHFS